MKKILYLALTVSLFITFPAWAQEEEAAALTAFLAGTYRIVGQWPDSDETYHGMVEMKPKGQGLEILRTINGRTVQAVGRITTVTADKITVLTVRFTHQGRKYEASYMIGGDLDNYARLTGYLYLEKGKTRQPGLEALFIAR